MKKYVTETFIISALLVTLVSMTASFHRNDVDLPVLTGAYELHYPAYFGNRTNLDARNPITQQGVYLGRMLFYDQRLSAGNAVSCATCHQQKLAFTDGKRFSNGVGKIPASRNSMSLANLLWVRSFFWDGRAKNLEEQVLEPLVHPDEMGSTLEEIIQKLQNTKAYPPLFKLTFGSDTITGSRIAQAIGQFERTLISANSRYDQYLQQKYKPAFIELKGMALFFNSGGKQISGANCGHCHSGPKIMGDVFHNNGLDSLPADAGRRKFTGLSADNGRFRAVSLRNIALTRPYMHDGRFNTLDEVLDHYSEHIKPSASLSPFLQETSEAGKPVRLNLSSQEKKEIIAFLHMLTDSTFISDPRFSNPFEN